MKGLAKRNTHVKYESPTTYKSKEITKAKVLLTEGQSDYYRASAISGALINERRGLMGHIPHLSHFGPYFHQSPYLIYIRSPFVALTYAFNTPES
jgi:hypothetical protein